MDKKTDNLLNPFLIDEQSSAKACGIGKSLFRQLDADGSLPACCKLHSRRLWSTRQLAIWSILGCPARNSDKWQKVLKSLKNEPERYL